VNRKQYKENAITLYTHTKHTPMSEAVTTHMSSDAIISIVTKMRNDSSVVGKTAEEKEEVFGAMYPAFKERYPMLMEMACADDFDAQRFQYIMHMRDQVMNKERTVDNASEEIGQKLFNVYVKPKVAQGSS